MHVAPRFPPSLAIAPPASLPARSAPASPKSDRHPASAESGFAQKSALPCAACTSAMHALPLSGSNGAPLFWSSVATVSAHVPPVDGNPACAQQPVSCAQRFVAKVLAGEGPPPLDLVHAPAPSAAASAATPAIAATYSRRIAIGGYVTSAPAQEHEALVGLLLRAHLVRAGLRLAHLVHGARGAAREARDALHHRGVAVRRRVALRAAEPVARRARRHARDALLHPDVA